MGFNYHEDYLKIVGFICCKNSKTKRLWTARVGFGRFGETGGAGAYKHQFWGLDGGNMEANYNMSSCQ